MASFQHLEPIDLTGQNHSKWVRLVKNEMEESNENVAANWLCFAPG